MEDPKGGFYGSCQKMLYMITSSHVPFIKILLLVTPTCRRGWRMLSSCMSGGKENKLGKHLASL